MHRSFLFVPGNRPELFGKEPSRMRRVARGAGHTEKDVAELLQRFGMMQKMIGSIGQQAGLLQRLPGMFVARARQLAPPSRPGRALPAARRAGHLHRRDDAIELRSPGCGRRNRQDL